MYEWSFEQVFFIWRGFLWVLGCCQQPAINTLREVQAFLSENPTEIVTIIIEDYVHTPKGLTNLFTNAGLDKYWFPVSKMPKKGEDWPTVTEMVQANRRLLVFTSDSSKEAKEGIAYEWKYMLENERKLVKYPWFLNCVWIVLLMASFGAEFQLETLGSYQAHARIENNRSHWTREVHLFSYRITSLHIQLKLKLAKRIQLHLLRWSAHVIKQQAMWCRTFWQLTFTWYWHFSFERKIHTCIISDWAFLAEGKIIMTQRSDGGGVFDTLDRMNGQTLCGCNTIAACQVSPYNLCLLSI